MAFSDKEKQREYQRRWVANRRAKYLSKLGGKCIRCGAAEDLELDHANRDAKVDHRIWSWAPARIEEELKKCQLLCVQCHVVKSIKESNYPKRKHGTLTMYKKGGCRCMECKEANSAYEGNRRANGKIAVIRTN